MEHLPASVLQDLSNACDWAFAAPFSRKIFLGSGGFLTAGRFVDAFCRRGILHELVQRTTGPQNELTAAVGARAAKDFARARAAERALEGTNEGLGGVGREITVTALTVGAELQHSCLPRYLDRCASDLRRRACLVPTTRHGLQM